MWYCTVGCLVTLALLVAPLAADAQPTGNVRRIGWLRSGDFAGPGRVDAFQQGLREMGYVEGQHYVIEHRSGAGKVEPLSDLAAELVRLPVEVLVTSGIAATLAAKAATSTTPIVFANVPEPVEMGLIASWTHPGGNLTGVANVGFEFIGGKHLELLKAIVPAATRIAVLTNPDNPVNRPALKAYQATAQMLKIALYVMEVRDPATELERAFATLAHERVDALIVPGDAMFIPYRTRIVELVAERRLPADYLSQSYVKVGGLMSYEPDRLAISRRVGAIVGEILHGAKPADIPAEYPMKFALSLNLKTAKALGLTMPPTLLLQADEVIQ
jgi:putative tryptophan/tyrosine transport system substrate-binding protein